MSDGRPRLVLASGSPRRFDLVSSLGLEPVVISPDVDETSRPGEAPAALVERLARQKAAVATGLDSVGPADTVLAADTVVVVDERTLGKPGDPDTARAMLRSLSGRRHKVLTGVAVVRGDQSLSTVVETSVEFVDLDETAIEWYLDTGEPTDKAGAYAIQGSGGAFVRRIDGSASTVIGLPLAETVELLTSVGHPVFTTRS